MEKQNFSAYKKLDKTDALYTVHFFKIETDYSEDIKIENIETSVIFS